VLDEAAHLATGVLVAGALPRRWRLEVLLTSNALDADHVPSEIFGRRWLAPEFGRPHPHTLLVPALALAARRPATAIGLLAHLGRDLADPATGVALLWPLSRRTFAIPTGAYHFALGALAAR
jgi:hypothetical protein